MRNYFALLCLLMFAAPVFAWGPEGHRIIADVARTHLTSSARLQVRELLGDDDLAAIANWADEIKSARPETAGWHFVDIPRYTSGFSEERDCYRPAPRHLLSDQDHHNCIVDRIELFQRVLADKSVSREKRIDALKFLVHFVGDIHQPLHAIAEARGGNEIQVIEFGATECGGRPCNLHFVWDVGLIEHSARSEKEYAASLERMISSENLWHQTGGTPEIWANESFQLAKKFWLNNDGAVDDPYYCTNINIVSHRLALAALRLAKLLSETLGR